MPLEKMEGRDGEDQGAKKLEGSELPNDPMARKEVSDLPEEPLAGKADDLPEDQLAGQDKDDLPEDPMADKKGSDLPEDPMKSKECSGLPDDSERGSIPIKPLGVGDIESPSSELTENQKKAIIAETGWSREIVNCIQSWEQYEVYKNANLHEETIDGRKCLCKDIDPDYIDPKSGLSNRELMKNGRAPIDSKTGEKIELHHMGQDFDSPFAELCENCEHGDGNHGTLHDMKQESWRRDPDLKRQYNNIQRPNHWKARAAEV